MYTSAATDILRDRIGWSKPATPAGFLISAENEKKLSGRVFRSSHPLAVVENVLATMPVSDAPGGTQISNNDLNAFLLEMKEQAAIKVLSRLFDQNDRADFATDYDYLLTEKPALFDSAYGYQVAFDVLQLMITSPRSNTRQANAADKADLIIQLNGAFDDNGKLVLRGVVHNLNAAIGALNDVLFPKVEQSATISDATYFW